MSLAPVSAQSAVLPAIRAAARASGVDFAYLAKQAEVESGLNPSAKAKTSTATGLYQFIESTWLAMAEKHGARYGLSGGREDLLAAREDPQMAAYMAAELAKENAAALQASWGGEVGATELYLAHFLGASGAADLLSARDADAEASAAALLPAAASANRGVFYGPDGAARSVAEVYDRFAAKFSGQQAAQAPRAAPGQIPFVREAALSTQSPLLNPVAVMLLAQLDAPSTGGTQQK
ncbi:MAG TPA: flagellar biosynthesis protein FlgJ [Rhodospirillaceae bacterium]|jgi:hypothetical protein|nr:transglycosylase SLT domain-containing protein [Alphaproteobacteria bacterium]HBH26743.1 flagellar biosynthesis protein FlgJ [Rhodospirillaceae bacterium]